ncbi:hypothetical protein ZWY2020_017266 [Hordeum vulgare]|nr:hypothetical protein ZWY2020_017266 [Hordeum vulgare]
MGGQGRCWVRGLEVKLREPALVARAATVLGRVREGTFLPLPACRGMGLSAVAVLPDANSSFLPPLDMHNTISCPQPGGHRKASVSNMDDAREQIGTTISTTLKEIKPISININWNLPLTCILLLSFFSPEPVKPDEPERN